MALVKDIDLARGGKESIEMARLRRELEEARIRLEEETVYFRAELEATRQRVEKQNVREHAEEVSKRRRLEQHALALKAELRQAQSEAEKARERADELARQLAQLQESSRRHTSQEVDKVRAAARDAWRSAEEELARAEQEHAATKRQLAEEQARAKELEETVARLQNEPPRSAGPDADTLKMIGALKKALWATAQARRRAEMQLAVLQAGEAPTSADQVQAVSVTYPQPTANPPTTSSDGRYNELNIDHLKSLKLGDVSDDLCDDFMLVPGDTSLDIDTFEKLKTLPDPEPLRQEAAKPIAEPKRAPEPRPTARARPEPVPAYEVKAAAKAAEPGWVDRSRNGLGRVIRNLTVGAAMTAAGYWLLESGLLAKLLES